MSTQREPISIVVPGQPRPKSRPRFNYQTGGVYSVKAQTIHENAIGWALREKLGHRRFHGPVHVYVRFYRGSRHPVDGDNLLKLVLDSANKIAWDDDRQVVKATYEVAHDKTNPRTEIEIWLAPEQETPC